MLKPQRFGRFILLDRLSTGGMAEVFLAKASGLQGFEKIFAIKRILPSVSEDSDFTTMFIDEAKISANLTHANIGQVFEFGQVQKLYYIAMEYIPGRDLRAIEAHLQDTGRVLELPAALFIAIRVCQALDYAHRQKGPSGASMEIVHRDVSPPNVLISFDGTVKLIDFGIAKAASRATRTRAGKLKGKFSYMSPEQVQGLPVDRRSDIFSLGVVLYELLTGSRLFHGENQLATLNLIRHAEVTPPSTVNPEVPLEVDRFVMKALARDREERYSWATELRAAIERFLARNGLVYSSQQLAAWMHEEFAGEVEAERLMRERIHDVKPEEVPPGDAAAEEGAGEGGPSGGEAALGDRDGRSPTRTRALDAPYTDETRAAGPSLLTGPQLPRAARRAEEVTAAGLTREAAEAMGSEPHELRDAPIEEEREDETCDEVGGLAGAPPQEPELPDVHQAPTVAGRLDPVTQQLLEEMYDEETATANGSPGPGTATGPPRPARPSELAAAGGLAQPVGAAARECDTDETGLPEVHGEPVAPARVFGPHSYKENAALAHLATALQADGSVPPPSAQVEVTRAAGDESFPVAARDEVEARPPGAIGPGVDRDAAVVGGALVTSARPQRQGPEVVEEPVDLTALGSVQGGVQRGGSRELTSPSGTRQVEAPAWSSIKAALIAAMVTLGIAATIFIIVGIGRDREPPIETGSILVTTNNPRAACSVALGMTAKGVLQPGGSLTLREVPPGRHVISLQCLGFHPYATTIQVKPAEASIVLATLRKQ